MVGAERWQWRYTRNSMKHFHPFRRWQRKMLIWYGWFMRCLLILRRIDTISRFPNQSILNLMMHSGNLPFLSQEKRQFLFTILKGNYGKGEPHRGYNEI